MGKLARAAFFVLALPAVVRAALRVTVLARRLPLDELVARLRGAPPFVVRPLLRPEWLLASLDRLLHALPPYRYGRCLKRSLLLLDLWARCGLHPRLHLAAPLARAGGRYEGHAWVTVEPANASLLGTSSEGYAEAFML
ncbi:MAG TPA: lasso peptide biosynthesis protein [Thermoanaerobaculia bacterium]|nr:lasso peptide biosynthesis protein [Thermoanaerobaculia bacterium]